MNMGAGVEVDWADGTYSFRLSVAGAIELEQKCDAPISTIFQRVASGGYSVADLQQTIRLGLIGGGLAPPAALKLVRQYVDERPLAESWPIAQAILGGLMFGFSEAPLPGKPVATAEAASASTPSPSIKRPPSSASLRSRLHKSACGSSRLQ